MPSIASSARLGISLLRANSGKARKSGLAWLFLAGLGLLAALTLTGGAGLGMRTRADRVAFALVTWFPVLLGFLFGNGLLALSSSGPMALLPSLKRRAVGAAVLWSAVAAALGFASSQVAGSLGPLNAVAQSFGAFAVTASLLLFAGTARGQRLFLLGLAAVCFFYTYPGFVGLEEVTTLNGVLNAAAGLGSLISVLWWFQPRSSVERDAVARYRSTARSAKRLADAAVPAPASASALERIATANRYLKKTPSTGSRTRQLLVLLVLVAGPIMAVLFLQLAYTSNSQSEMTFAQRAYDWFVSPAANDSHHRKVSSVLLLPLMFLPMFTLSQHAGLGVPSFSRRTLGAHSFRQFLWQGGTVTLLTIGLASLLSAVTILTSGKGLPDRAPVFLAAALYVVPALPWVASLTVLLQGSRFVRARKPEGRFLLRSYLGLAVGFAATMAIVEVACHYTAKLQAAPESHALRWAITCALGLLGFAAGLFALRRAFARYYAVRPLDPGPFGQRS